VQSDTPPVTPEPIMQAIFGGWVAGLVKGSVDLNVYGAILKGAREAAEIAERVSAPERTTRILCDALVGIRFLTKDDLGRYGVVPFAEAFLDPEKPSYLGNMVNIFANPVMWDSQVKVAETVRNGGTLLERNALTPEHEFWETFAQSTFAFGRSGAQMMAAELNTVGWPKGARILDLACGTGVYGFVAASQDPESRITCVDWPNVLKHTRGYAERMGLSGRVEYREGDIFTTDIGTNYDLVIMANVHHHFDPETCVKLNQRAKAALKPGGTVAVVDFIADEARRDDTRALLFGIVMMTWTPRGSVFTESEYRDLFHRAGFKEILVRRSPTSAQAVLLAR
jgi:cyclopropane fatty-acyl-phospholipid synthase-like methyltransferase